VITGGSIVYVTPRSPSVSVTPYRSLVRHTLPAVEPVTLAEVKRHCRVDTDDSDEYLATAIAVAREYCEDRLDTTFVNTVWEARYDTFPLWEIVLPRPPMQSDSVTVQYRDESGASHTITSSSGSFQVDHRTTPGRVYPLYNGVWPAVRGDENSVTVRWTAGYGASPASTPAVCRHAMLLLCAHWFATREPVTVGSTAQNASIPHTFDTLIAAAGWGPYR
jgi:uncharacterized phiE125 gp8 family phage protein